MSCVGIAGSHFACAQTEPSTAWIEGSADYFSVIMGNSDPNVDQVGSNYVDTIGTLAAGSRTFHDDLEKNDVCSSSAYGNREQETTSRILWDLADAAPDFPDDYQISEQVLFRLIRDMKYSTSCDIDSFVALLCLRAGSDAFRYRPILQWFNVIVPAGCDTPVKRRRAVRR